MTYIRTALCLFLFTTQALSQAQVLPRVHILATGGTIASTGNGLLTASDLRSAIPELEQVASISIEDFVTIPSSRMTPEIQFKLAQRVNELLDSSELAGVVITHGTDSLEESAFFLDLLVNSSKPVVFTAAQRPPTRVDTDGPRNLLNAVLIAADDRSIELGVMITLNDEIHAARNARKTHSTAVEAFRSAGTGKLGYVDEGRVFYLWKPTRRVHLLPESIQSHVDLIRLVAGSDGHLIKAAVQTGAKGIVIEVFGRGNVPPAAVVELGKAIEQGVVVVFTTRTGDGRVILYPWAREMGVVSGEDLDGLKARMVLIAALGQHSNKKIIQEIYTRLSGSVAN
jgi:L-asparaginase